MEEQEPTVTEEETVPVEGDTLPDGPPKRGRGRPRKSAGADSSGSPAAAPADKPAAPKRATKVAVDAAGDAYSLLGTAVSVAGFQAAGFTMQAQRDEAGKVIANYCLLHAPAAYSFLESSGKATAIVPLVLAPIAADVYMRTRNPQLEMLCAGLLGQMLKDATVQLPNPDAPDGVAEVPILPLLHQARAENVRGWAAETMAEADATMNGSPPSDGVRVPTPEEAINDLHRAQAERHQESPAAQAVRGDAWSGFPSGEDRSGGDAAA